MYRKDYDRISEKVAVEFCKVEAHSGDEFNNRADKLAKEACGI